MKLGTVTDFGNCPRFVKLGHHSSPLLIEVDRSVVARAAPDTGLIGADLESERVPAGESTERSRGGLTRGPRENR